MKTSHPTAIAFIDLCNGFVSSPIAESGTQLVLRPPRGDLNDGGNRLVVRGEVVVDRDVVCRSSDEYFKERR